MLRVYFGAVFLAPFNIVLCPEPSTWTKRLTTTSNLRAVRNRASCLPVVSLAWRSNRHTLTTLSTASINHLTASLGCHSLAKTMGCFAALFTGLICAFHNPYYLTTHRLSWRHQSDPCGVATSISIRGLCGYISWPNASRRTGDTTQRDGDSTRVSSARSTRRVGNGLWKCKAAAKCRATATDAILSRQ